MTNFHWSKLCMYFFFNFNLKPDSLREYFFKIWRWYRIWKKTECLPKSSIKSQEILRIACHFAFSVNEYETVVAIDLVNLFINKNEAVYWSIRTFVPLDVCKCSKLVRWVKKFYILKRRFYCIAWCIGLIGIIFTYFLFLWNVQKFAHWSLIQAPHTVISGDSTMTKLLMIAQCLFGEERGATRITLQQKQNVLKNAEDNKLSTPTLYIA